MNWKSWFPAFLFFVFISALAEVSARFGLIPTWLLPAPSQVIQVLIEMKSDFLTAFLQTFEISIFGLILSFCFGVSLACLLSLSSILESAISPIAIFFQTVPVVAIAPLLVIWFGFGQTAVLACSLIVSFFPILANTLVGLKSTSEENLELALLYRLSKFQVLLSMRMPLALMQIFSGLKVASGLAIIGTIVGEFVAGGGLGGLIDSARTQQRVDIVFACLFLCSLFGVFLLALITFIESSLLRWRPFYSLGRKV